MTPREIARFRLSNQMIGNSPRKSAGEVVTAMGAIQAQDYLASLWAVGVRLEGATEADIEKAIADRTIVRSWPMRGTLHLVSPADLRWMLEYLSPRVLAAAARRHRELELDDAVFARSEKLFIRAMGGGKVLERPGMMDILERAGIVTANQRGYHILWRLALRGLLCGGPRQGKQQTFVLLDEWLPRTPRRSRDDAMADLALRYFTSHGPATVDDFSWWTGLTKTEAAAVIGSVASKLASFTSNGSTCWLRPSASVPSGRVDDLHLLPSFDELLLGYTDRSVAVAPTHARRVTPGSNGMFMPIVVKAGRVVGTWKRTFTKKNTVSVVPEAFASFSKADLRAWNAGAKQYADFLGKGQAARSR